MGIFIDNNIKRQTGVHHFYYIIYLSKRAVQCFTMQWPSKSNFHPATLVNDKHFLLISQYRDSFYFNRWNYNICGPVNY